MENNQTNRLFIFAESLAKLSASRAEKMILLRHQREDLEAAEIAAKPSAEAYASLGSNKEARELAVEKMLAENKAIQAIKSVVAELTDALAIIEAEINGAERMFQAFSISVNNETNTVYNRRDIIGSVVITTRNVNEPPIGQIDPIPTEENGDEWPAEESDLTAEQLGFDTSSTPTNLPDDDIPF